MTANFRWTLHDRLLFTSEGMEDAALTAAVREWSSRIASGSLSGPVISTTYLGPWGPDADILSQLEVNWDDVDL